MPPLAWLSSTVEGSRLGELAASQVQLDLTPLPWWFFPLEPWRWFFDITGEAAHGFYTIIYFLIFSILLGLLLARRSGWRSVAGISLTTYMFLMGGLESLSWAKTCVPFGNHWIVPADAQFRLADLHCHSQASGGALMPEELLRWHIDRGYSVVAVTDSNKTYGAELAQREAERLHLPVIVVPGEEYRGVTHLLMLNLKQPISADEVPLPQAVQQARAQGAIVIAAHAWTGIYGPEQLVEFGVSGFETVNRRTIAGPSIFRVCQQRSLAQLGNLDFRDGTHPRTATVLPLWADTPEKIQQALQRGECAALYFPNLVENIHFSRMTRLRGILPEHWQEGGRLLLPGTFFWALVGWLTLKGLRLYQFAPLSKGQANLTLASMVVAAGLSGGLAAWSMWWKFKQAWFPHIGWAIAFWMGACTYCALQCWRLTSTLRAGPGRNCYPGSPDANPATRSE